MILVLMEETTAVTIGAVSGQVIGDAGSLLPLRLVHMSCAITTTISILFLKLANHY